MLFRSRNYRGRIADNSFDTIGRDAILIGHANRVRVEGNKGRMIGYPAGNVDLENGSVPAAMAAFGKFDEGVFTKNRFEEINGRCFDLDGFHDGEIGGNVCLNRGGGADYPNGNYALALNNTDREASSRFIVIRDNLFDGTKFGGIFLIGKGHKIVGNRLLNLNRWKCNEGIEIEPCRVTDNEPDWTRAGIFLAERAGRRDPAQENLVEENEITGYNMAVNCVLASPRASLSANTVRRNRCSNTN